MADFVLLPAVHFAECHVIAIGLKDRVIAMPLFTPHRPDDLPGHFVAFNSYEWTCSHFDDKPNYGHYNILYREDGPMLRTLDEDYNSVQKVAAAPASS